MFAVETTGLNGQALADLLYQCNINIDTEAFWERSIILLNCSHLTSVIAYAEKF